MSTTRNFINYLDVSNSHREKCFEKSIYLHQFNYLIKPMAEGTKRRGAGCWIFISIYYTVNFSFLYVASVSVVNIWVKRSYKFSMLKTLLIFKSFLICNYFCSSFQCLTRSCLLEFLCSLTVNASWKTEGTQAEEKSYGFCQMKCESPKFL